MKQAHIGGGLLGFQATKRRAALPAKKGKEEGLTKSGLAPEGGAGETEALFKTETVKVDALIKRVYRKLDQKSYLVWGLTSDWMVSSNKNASSTRTSSRLQALGSENNGGIAKRVEDGATDSNRDDASEGYGEMTAGSVERMLLVLQRIHEHVPAKLLPRGRSADQWALTRESSFIDIGSGYGKVVFHAALAVGTARAYGVEYVQSRHDIAAQVLAEYTGGGGDLGEEARERIGRLGFACQDATANSWIDFSHVYMYDKVFSDKTVERLAAILNRSKAVRVLVSYKRHELWYRLGLSKSFVEVTSITMNTTGSQNFRCHVFVKVD